MIFNETFAPVSDEQVMSDDAMAQARKNMEEGQALNPLMRPDAGFFEGMGNAWKGLPSGALKTVSSLVTAASEVVGENLATTPEAKAWLNAQSQNMKEAAKSLRQYNRETFGADPDTIGTAGQVLYGLAETLPKAMAFGSGLGVAGGALVFGADMGINTTQDLKDRGVDENTATWAGVESFAANSVGMRLPAALGATRLRSVGFGAVSNVGLNVAEQQGIKWTLENQNYDEIAKQYDVHMSDLIVAGAMGGAFGGAFWRKTPTAQEVQLAQMKMRTDAYIRARDGLINEYRDALLSLRKEDGTQMFTSEEALAQATLGANAEVSFAIQNGWTIEQLHANRARIDIDNALRSNGELPMPYITERPGAEGRNARVHSDSEPLNKNGVIAKIPDGIDIPSGDLILTIGFAKSLHRGMGLLHNISHWVLDVSQRDYRRIPDVDPTSTSNANNVIDSINGNLRGKAVDIYKQTADGKYVLFLPEEEHMYVFSFDGNAKEYKYVSEKHITKEQVEKAANEGGKWESKGAATLRPVSYPLSGEGMSLGGREQLNPESSPQASDKTTHFTDTDITINEKGMPKVSIGANSSDVAKLGERQRAEREAFTKDDAVEGDNAAERKETPSEVKKKAVEYLQTAWHGSPYRFDKFTLDHIGEGEGAQAHGWGLYFALKRDTAMGYRAKLANEKSGKSFEDWAGSKKFGGMTMVEWASRLERNGEYDRADMVNTLATNYSIEETLISADEMGYSESDKAWLKKTFSAIKKPPKSVGTLFSVEIPEDNVMLREDARISQQSVEIMRAFSSLREELKGLIEDFKSSIEDGDFSWYEDGYDKEYAAVDLERFEDAYKLVENRFATGRDYYTALSEVMGSPKAASEHLNSIGIKGIRYNGGMDGECAVIFDDKAVEIKEFFQRNPNAVGFARKVMGAYNPETNRIRLTSNANISTFAHENSHWYMTNLFKFAHGDNVPETIRADVKTLLDAWGIKSLEEWDALGLEGQRKYQEQFASWTETYLAEGKAPSESLKGVFERLGKWIVDTYRSALGKDVEAAVGERYQAEFGEQLPPISDEVRKVLDRMYTDQIEASRKQIRATEEQVAAARLIQSQRLAQDKRDALLADRNNMESVEASTRAEQLAEEQIIEGRPVDISELADDIGFDNNKVAQAERELMNRYKEDPATQTEERTRDGVPQPDETEVAIAETANGISEVVNAVNEVSRSAGLGDAINADAVNAAVENTARQIRETVISPRRQARMDRAMQAVDPEIGEIVHAENIARGAKDMVFTFERDDGTSVQMTAEQALAEADAEIAKAKRESAGIAEAAVCAINNGGLQ